MIAIALSKPSNKAIFFNNTSVFREISEGSNNLKSEFTKLSTSSDSNRNLYVTARDVSRELLYSAEAQLSDQLT
jgi:hypothetical protein